MQKIFVFAAFATLVAGAAAAQERPAGWEMTGCNGDAFAPVMTDAGEVAYWTNATCPAAADGTEHGNRPPSDDEGGGTDIFEDLLQ